eukprot:4671829-Prymnesium_polylepis.3
MSQIARPLQSQTYCRPARPPASGLTLGALFLSFRGSRPRVLWSKLIGSRSRYTRPRRQGSGFSSR